MSTKSIRIEQDAYEKAKIYCDKNNHNISWFVSRSINFMLNAIDIGKSIKKDLCPEDNAFEESYLMDKMKKRGDQ